MAKSPNPDPERYCSVIVAARTFKKTYHQVRDMFTTGKIDGDLIDGRLWLNKNSVSDYVLELDAREGRAREYAEKMEEARGKVEAEIANKKSTFVVPHP